MIEYYSVSPWTNRLIVSTILGIVIIIGAIVFLCYLYTNHSKSLFFAISCIISICLLVITLLVTLLLMPRGVSKNEKGLTVHLLAKNIHIPADEIVSVEAYPMDEKTIRVFGSGGVFGYIGVFSNDKVGEFVCYATDWSNSYIIRRRNKRPIVITIENPRILKNI